MNLYNLSYWIDDRRGHYRPELTDWIHGECRVFYTRFPGTAGLPGEDDLYLFYSESDQESAPRHQIVLRFITSDTGKTCFGQTRHRNGRELEFLDELLFTPNMESREFRDPFDVDTSSLSRHDPGEHQ